MQVIIPLAGKGTRLRPHTHLTPKPMLKVAGRPVIDWVMDRLKGLQIDELIFITGHLKEQVEAYARSHYTTPSRFIEQNVQDGTAGAVNLARPFVKGPVMIIFVDTVFEADLSLAETSDADGIIWAKEVEDYQRYGVVVTDSAGYMTKIVEKPSEPISKLANIGLYYTTPSRFIEQKVQDGTAGAVNLARPFVKGPVMIIFVDTVFEADLSLAETSDADGIIWAKEVEDYQRYGVVVTDSAGYMTKIVEKPSEPISKLANIGLYYIKDVDALWRGIDHVLQSPANKGEFFLTDAFQHMIEHGKRILTAEVGGWYDCGQLGTTLETNGILLAHGAARHAPVGPTVTLVEPVLIEDGCTIERSTIGPNVTLEAGCTVRDSTIADAIIGAGCTIERSRLTQAMLGEAVIVRDFTGSGSIGASSDVAGAA